MTRRFAGTSTVSGARSDQSRSFPYLGHGIGLCALHHRRVLEERPAIVWFEVVSENFLGPGGDARRVLRSVRERHPVVLHGVGMSIGSVDPVDDEYLGSLASLAAEIEPAWVSDHLCWSSIGGHCAHDLWPLLFTTEARTGITARRDRIRRR